MEAVEVWPSGAGGGTPEAVSQPQRPPLPHAPRTPSGLPFSLSQVKTAPIYYGRKRKDFSDFSFFGIGRFILAEGEWDGSCRCEK